MHTQILLHSLLTFMILVFNTSNYVERKILSPVSYVVNYLKRNPKD